MGCGHCRSCQGVSSGWELLELGLHCQINTQGGDLPAEALQHKLAPKLSPNLCHAWLFQALSSFECPTDLSAAPFYHRHPPPRAFCRPSTASLPPSPTSVVPTCVIMSQFNAVNSDFHVKCLFFTHQMNVCNVRV